MAWFRFWATFRRRLGGYLALVLLIGLIGGTAMGAARCGTAHAVVVLDVLGEHQPFRPQREPHPPEHRGRCDRRLRRDSHRHDPPLTSRFECRELCRAQCLSVESRRNAQQRLRASRRQRRRPLLRHGSPHDHRGPHGRSDPCRRGRHVSRRRCPLRAACGVGCSVGLLCQRGQHRTRSLRTEPGSASPRRPQGGRCRPVQRCSGAGRHRGRELDFRRVHAGIDSTTHAVLHAEFGGGVAARRWQSRRGGRRGGDHSGRTAWGPTQ